MARAHVFISGLVQGVFFRYHTKEKADSFGLTGWVRNLFDGRVEAVFEGEREKVEKMIKWCREQGSPGSRVENVEVEWEKAEGKWGGFTINY